MTTYVYQYRAHLADVIIGLRKAADKDVLDYHDFFFNKTISKYLNSHSHRRMETLKKEGHKIVVEKELIPFVKTAPTTATTPVSTPNRISKWRSPNC